MEYQRVIRAAVCATSICAAVCAAGCSVSFCGFPIGGHDELVFSCQEESSASSGGPEDEKDVQSLSQEGQDGTRESLQSEAGSGTGAVTPDGRVNINSAGVEDLMTLKGIGAARAEAIIEYRAQNGLFTKAEDIMQVPGIKEGIFSKIQNQIAVD